MARDCEFVGEFVLPLWVRCAHSFSVEAPRSDQMVINCGDVGEDPRVGVGCE